ncbi:MAG: hypothetical protein M1816_003220 [Peltula sp. TS41687]|nr:MAG: hypothetical protein M1816_003220 [Peltula sp. TS41687]
MSSPPAAHDQDDEKEEQDEVGSTPATALVPSHRLSPSPSPSPAPVSAIPPSPPLPTNPTRNHIHNLLLLSDSALPLGSFAFSSGLESYLAHSRHSHRPTTHSHLRSSSPHHPSSTATHITRHFLTLSLTSLASTSLPYVLAAHRATLLSNSNSDSASPTSLASLHETYDATQPCAVARRASLATGKALASVFDRAFAPHHQSHQQPHPAHQQARQGRRQQQQQQPTHFAPLWGSITATMGLSAEQAAYVYLLNHVKSVLSAAVRIGAVQGPYQAQGLLASDWVRREMERVLERYWDVGVEDAGQTVPVLDLWGGRHERLYSRIFNS